MRYSLRSVLVAATAGSVLLVACSTGSDTSSGATLPPIATVSDTASAAYNDADVVFAQSMIPHHRGAVAMAEMALAPGSLAGAEVQALATQIQGAQDPEIEQMTSLLTSWGEPVDMPGMEQVGEMESMEAAGGMMSADDTAALAALTGPQFDAAWAAAMIVHHEGAVSMARSVRDSGVNPEVRDLADAIITGQQAEIDQMLTFSAS